MISDFADGDIIINQLESASKIIAHARRHPVEHAIILPLQYSGQPAANSGFLFQQAGHVGGRDFEDREPVLHHHIGNHDPFVRECAEQFSRTVRGEQFDLAIDADDLQLRPAGEHDPQRGPEIALMGENILVPIMHQPGRGVDLARFFRRAGKNEARVAIRSLAVIISSISVGEYAPDASP